MLRWHKPDYQVLVVCTANICRSPVAEALLRHQLLAMGLANRVQVRSAGTRVAQRGRHPDPRMCRLAAEAQVPIGRIRSKPLTARLIAASDIVLVMEWDHLDEVEQICPRQQIPDGVHLLGSYLVDEGDDVLDIPDPYFGTSQACAEVFDLLESALAVFAVRLGKQLSVAEA